MTRHELLPPWENPSGGSTDAPHDQTRAAPNTHTRNVPNTSTWNAPHEGQVEDERASPAQILNALADADSRRILTVTRTRPLSVADIVDSCNIPTATAYRKVNRLVDAGLLDEHIRIRPYGRNVCKYSLRVESIHATLTGNDDPTVHVSVTTRASRQESEQPLTDGGETDAPPEVPPEQERLRSLFMDVTGTDELRDEQECDSLIRQVETADDVAVSEYVTTVARDDGLTDTLPEPDSETSK